MRSQEKRAASSVPKACSCYGTTSVCAFKTHALALGNAPSICQRSNAHGFLSKVLTDLKPTFDHECRGTASP